MEKAMTSMENYSSKTAEVKAIIRAFMADQDGAVERRQITECVTDQIDVTDGVIAGAIKMMTLSGELMVPRRGIYERGTEKAKALAFEKIYNVCKRFEHDLNRVCTFNMLELTDAEKHVYPEFNGVLTRLRGDVQSNMLELHQLINVVQTEKNETFFPSDDVAVAESLDTAPEFLAEPELSADAGVEIDAGVETENSIIEDVGTDIGLMDVAPMEPMPASDEEIVQEIEKLDMEAEPENAEPEADEQPVSNQNGLSDDLTEADEKPAKKRGRKRR